MELLHDNGLVFAYSTDHPEEFLIINITLSMFQRMFINYIIPITKRILPLDKLSSFLRPQQTLSAVKHRKYIAAHVKTVYEQVKIFVLNNPALCNEILDTRMKLPINFIGLDCEWNSAKKNGVALIQLSSGNDCLLYNLHQADGKVPDSLKLLLEDRKVLKFGVAIQEDVRRLRNHGINVRGFVDLRNLAQRCIPMHDQVNSTNTTEEEGLRWSSLRSLSTNLLEIKLNKNHHIRCGDWETDLLSKAQVLYAAKDAIVSLEIFYALILLRKVNRHSLSILPSSFNTTREKFRNITTSSSSSLLDSNFYSYLHSTDLISDINISPSLDFHLTKPSPWLSELAYSLCQGIVDVNHKYRPPIPSSKKVPNLQSSRAFSTGKTPNSKQYKHQCRDKPLYENCFLLAPDNRVLATVNHSKAQWYVHKGLGEVESETPFKVRLLFEPSGRPMPDADYYTTTKENVCVVCGGNESFVRKMIIPHDYRKYFPQNFKDHMSHDVLLMCLQCHRYAQQNDELLRQELAEKYKAPLGTKERMMFIDNPQLSHVRSSAKALLHSGSKIPDKRRKELESVILKYNKAESVDEEMLKDIMQINVKVENKSFEGLHGERVVKSIIEEGSLVEFVRMWRKSFLESMQPRFLPPMWSVDHNLHKIDSNWMAEDTTNDEKMAVQ